jgi:hypothetical protein
LVCVYVAVVVLVYVFVHVLVGVELLVGNSELVFVIVGVFVGDGGVPVHVCVGL